MDYQFSKLERILESDPSNMKALAQYDRLCLRANKDKARTKFLSLITKSLRHDFYSNNLSDGKTKLTLIEELIPSLEDIMHESNEFKDLSNWVDANILTGKQIFELEVYEASSGNNIIFQHGNLEQIPLILKENNLTQIVKGDSNYWIVGNIYAIIEIKYIIDDATSLKLMGRHFELFDESFNNNLEISEPFIKWIYDNLID